MMNSSFGLTAILSFAKCRKNGVRKQVVCLRGPWSVEARCFHGVKMILNAYTSKRLNHAVRSVVIKAPKKKK